ncbi:inner membrane protein YbjM [Enterobacteriaceae bacterium LUAb1]
MVLRAVSVRALFSGALAYAGVFVFICYKIVIDGDVAATTRLNVLLFMLPGILVALTSREKTLVTAFFSSLIAIPFCLAMTHLPLFNGHLLWQEIAWLFSTIFWCVMGALMIMLWRDLLRLHRHKL